MTRALILILLLQLLNPVATFHDVSHVRSLDGDTWESDVRLTPLGITFRARMRPLNLDCAEVTGTNKAAGLVQRAGLDSLLTHAKTQRVDLYGRDSFGRWLVRSWADSVEVVPYMRARGCAVWP